jgi:hypothetical protein
MKQTIANNLAGEPMQTQAQSAALAEPGFSLHRDAFGRLVLTGADGVEHRGVVPIRAFPIGAPEFGIGLVGTDGEELAWIAQLSDLPDALHALIRSELANREFMPEITRIVHVSTYATPSIWTIETNRGNTVFTLRGEEDIRRILRTSLLISDSHGVQFLVRDTQALDAVSRKILDRFL